MVVKHGKNIVYIYIYLGMGMVIGIIHGGLYMDLYVWEWEP
jgi:hypothetical protein